MGDKAGAVEGSSIFENLFGGFSNGLSIFTNNPFRRKQEAAAAKAEAEAKSFGNGEDAGEKKFAEAVGGFPYGKSPTESESGARKQKKSSDEKGSESQEPDDGRLKKAKRAEDVNNEKRRRRVEDVGESAEQEGNAASGETGSIDRKKRQPESSPLSVDEESPESQVEVNVKDKESTKKKKRRKKGEEEAYGEGDLLTEPVRRQSERHLRKRASEEPGKARETASLSESITGTGEQKVENGASGDGIADEDSTKGKRGAHNMEVPEKRKKKMKLVHELNQTSPRLSDTAEVTEIPDKGYETRAGSKRKKEMELEMNYEKRQKRGTGDLKEDGGVADMDLAEPNSKGKRKVVDDDDSVMSGKGKKRKLTKDERLQNEEKLRRTIFVGNISVDVKPKHLVTEFTQYGPVESARLRSVPIVDVKMPRKAAVITRKLNENRTSLNGYVVFKDVASAKAALSHNMKEFRGKHLRVDSAATGSSGVQYDRKRSIFVGNLPFDVEDEAVIAVFQGSTPDLEVEAVRVVRDPQTSAGKGMAYVCFKTKLGAETALDRKEFTMLKKNKLRIERCKPIAEKTRASLRGAETSRPRLLSGAEERLSRKAPASYEGTRSGKQKGVVTKGREKGGASTPRKTGKRASLTKRPAVAAKKARALQMKSGGIPGAKIMSGGKKKREEKGKGKKKKPSK